MHGPAVTLYKKTPKEIRMKRLALVAAVLAVAACGQKEAGTTDTTDVMTPPPVVDTTAPVGIDTTADTANAADSAHQM
jgi:ABC-type glycerol-3-phosphate transport system substrate-binding protein